MSELHFTVQKEDVSGRGIQFWRGPSSYNFDSLALWREEHGDPWYTVDSAWHLRVFEVHWPEDWEPDTGPQHYEIHDEFHESWDEAMHSGNYILSEPRSIEGPDRARELSWWIAQGY